jgi:type II secretory pathway pseudopilin PulG
MLNRPPIRSGRLQGSVLLEVVLALVLFVAAAAIVGTALQAAIDSEERLRLGVHADNLAATVVAELEAGLRSPAVSGPAPFEPPFTNWTWQIIPPAGDAPGSPHEIVVRHPDPELVRRLAQVIVPRPGAGTVPRENPSEASVDAP